MSGETARHAVTDSSIQCVYEIQPEFNHLSRVTIQAAVILQALLVQDGDFAPG